MTLRINTNYITMPNAGIGINTQRQAPYTIVNTITGGTASSYTYYLNNSSTQPLEIIFIVSSMSVGGPVSEYITTAHQYGQHNWTLGYAIPTSSNLSTVTTNVLGVSGTTTSGYRMIKFTRGAVSGSTYNYTVQVTAIGLGTGVFRHCSGYGNGYGPISSITHSLSSSNFSSYNSRLYIL